MKAHTQLKIIFGTACGPFALLSKAGRRHRAEDQSDGTFRSYHFPVTRNRIRGVGFVSLAVGSGVQCPSCEGRHPLDLSTLARRRSDHTRPRFPIRPDGEGSTTSLDRRIRPGNRRPVGSCGGVQRHGSLSQLGFRAGLRRTLLTLRETDPSAVGPSVPLDGTTAKRECCRSRAVDRYLLAAPEYAVHDRGESIVTAPRTDGIRCSGPKRVASGAHLFADGSADLRWVTSAGVGPHFPTSAALDPHRWWPAGRFGLRRWTYRRRRLPRGIVGRLRRITRSLGIPVPGDGPSSRGRTPPRQTRESVPSPNRCRADFRRKEPAVHRARDVTVGPPMWRSPADNGSYRAGATPDSDCSPGPEVSICRRPVADTRAR